MAKIFPLRGILYNPAKVPNLDAVMTPPYDIISQGAQEKFYQKHPFNMIRLDFGMEALQDTPQDNRYTRSARYFRQWISDGILIQDPEPAIYFYRIQYQTPADSEKIIRGFIAATELEDFESGKIIPHEHTLSGPKTDRLNLTRACEANFSLIFSLFRPTGGSLIPALESHVQGKTPRVDVRDGDGIRHTLWSITQPDVISELQKALENRAIYIADGHHRYETSLNYRNERRARAGSFSGEEPFNRVMMFFSETSDDGLMILPTHRLVFNLPEERIRSFFARVRDCFESKTYPFTRDNEPKVREQMLRDLAEQGKQHHTFGLSARNREEYHLLTLKDVTLVDREGPVDHSPSWRRLDVSILQIFILERLLGINMETLKKEEHLHYVRGEAEALQKMREGDYQLAFLLNPTRMEEIIAVAGAGDRMPQKSTYFYPKLLTGLVIHRL